jgi:hypothetical protein
LFLHPRPVNYPLSNHCNFSALFSDFAYINRLLHNVGDACVTVQMAPLFLLASSLMKPPPEKKFLTMRMVSLQRSPCLPSNSFTISYTPLPSLWVERSVLESKLNNLNAMGHLEVMRRWPSSNDLCVYKEDMAGQVGHSIVLVSSLHSRYLLSSNTFLLHYIHISALFPSTFLNASRDVFSRDSRLP